jgi:integrase
VVFARDECEFTSGHAVLNLVHSYTAFMGTRTELLANPFHHKIAHEELAPAKAKWGKDKPHIPPGDVGAFLSCESDISPGWRRVKNALAVLGGARDGELHGLRWKSVNLEHEIPRDTVDVRLSYKTKDGRYAEDDTLKTDAAHRVIPLDELALVRVQAQFDEGWEAWVGRPPEPDDYVRPNAEGQPWRPACQSDLRRSVRWNLCRKGRRMDFSHADAVDKFSYA